MNELTVRGNESSGLMRYVAENDQVAIAGDLLLFKKGLWYRGGAEFSPGTRAFLANPLEAWTGWCRWEDGKPVEHRIVRVAEYAGRISREALGDMDKNAWPTNDHGVPTDPWQPSDRILLRTTDSAEEILTFVSGSRGGRNALASLMGKVARSTHYTDDGMYPVVNLISGSYEHDSFGLVHVPEFRIIDWAHWDRERAADTPRGSAALLAAAKEVPGVKSRFSEQLNDDIPF